MSDYVEETLCRTKKEADRMRSLCREALANEPGRKLLAALCRARHPMIPRFDLHKPDPIPAAFRDGQADVIQFLWRYGSDLRQPPEPSQTNEGQPEQ